MTTTETAPIETPDFFNMDIDTLMQEDAKNNANYVDFEEVKKEIFKPTGDHRVRFLVNFKQGAGFYLHKGQKSFTKKDGNTIKVTEQKPCWKPYGLPCSYCENENEEIDKKFKTPKLNLAYPLTEYVEATGVDTAKVFFANSFKVTVIGQLQTLYDKWVKTRGVAKASITDRDFYIERIEPKNKNEFISYSLVNEDPSDFEFSQNFPGLDSPDVIKALKACVIKTIILCLDPALAGELGLTEADKISNFFTAKKKPAAAPVQKAPSQRRVAVTKPVEAPADEDAQEDIKFDDEDEDAE